MDGIVLLFSRLEGALIKVEMEELAVGYRHEGQSLTHGASSFLSGMRTRVGERFQSRARW